MEKGLFFFAQAQTSLTYAVFFFCNRPTYPGEFDPAKHLYTLSYPVRNAWICVITLVVDFGYSGLMGAKKGVLREYIMIDPTSGFLFITRDSRSFFRFLRSICCSINPQQVAKKKRARPWVRTLCHSTSVTHSTSFLF